MGLDISHGAWSGAYSAFMRWRRMIAQAAGIPLMLMEGFYNPPHPEVLQRLEENQTVSILVLGFVKGAMCGLPLKWEALNPDPLHALLNHSDCDGWIPPATAGKVADRLEELLPLLPDEGWGHMPDPRAKTEQFIKGARAAAANKERLTFH